MSGRREAGRTLLLSQAAYTDTPLPLYIVKIGAYFSTESLFKKIMLLKVKFPLRVAAAAFVLLSKTYKNDFCTNTVKSNK